MRRLLFIAFFLCACSSDSGSSAPAADPLDAVGDAQVAHDQTTGTDSATAPDGTETSPPGCESDEACEAGEICACDGTCVQLTGDPCTEPKNCGSGTWCNTCVGQCEATVELCEPCSEGGVCGLDAACVPLVLGGTYCGADCLTDAGCPAGYSCVAVEGISISQCVPDSGDCAELGLCEDSGDCPDGEKCLQKQCVVGCTEDGSCPQGSVCVSAECVAPCLSDADCEAPATCEADGHCRAPGWCENGGDCEPGSHCDKVSHLCEPGCLADADCQDASLICEATACVPKGCQHNYQCGFSEECDAASGLCAPTPDPHCATCDASQEDNTAACGSAEALCVTMQDKDEVEQGDFCLLPCADDPIDQCPQAYGCTHIEAPDAGIDGWFCVRECWIEPF